MSFHGVKRREFDLPWSPRFCLNGWRASKGCVVDGRLFGTETDCWRCCWALNRGEG